MEESPKDIVIHNIRSQFFRIVYGSGAIMATNRDDVIIQFFSEHPKVPDQSSLSPELGPRSPKELVREMEVGIVMSKENVKNLARLLMTAGETRSQQKEEA